MQPIAVPGWQQCTLVSEPFTARTFHGRAQFLIAKPTTGAPDSCGSPNAGLKELPASAAFARTSSLAGYIAQAHGKQGIRTVVVISGSQGMTEKFDVLIVGGDSAAASRTGVVKTTHVASGSRQLDPPIRRTSAARPAYARQWSTWNSLNLCGGRRICCVALQLDALGERAVCSQWPTGLAANE
jgi:hypothetical protein